MKKLFIVLIICLLFSGCVLPRTNSSSNVITTDYGSYTIPISWSKRNDHSTSSKYFFTNKNDKKNPPNNISVEKGTNYYSKDDHLKFRNAILLQMGNQAKNYGMTLTSSGSNTKNGYVVYTFTMKGNNQTTVQHYIVGDYNYVLVHETIWNNDEEDTHNAAKTIVDSFKWKE